MKGGICHHCGAQLTALDYGRQDTCRKCRRDTRVCLNCEHYEKGAHNDCRENQAERVLDKEKSNFCDYFKPSDRASAGAASRESLKNAAEALFRKK